jgi:replication factor A1
MVNDRPCQKKVAQSANGDWLCDKCNIYLPKPSLRYVVTMRVNDHSGSNWFSCFNDVATELIGHSADTLAAWKENKNEAAFEQAFVNATFRQLKFRIRAKHETYMDETRVKFHVMNATPINFAEESRSLVDTIRKYQGR